MIRRFQGLNQTAHPNPDELPEGFYLVRVDRVQYRWHAQKPFYALRLAVLEPQEFSGQSLAGRLYCTPKALWKLAWFLRDFGYDGELLGRDEVSEQAIRGLRGVVKISHSVVWNHAAQFRRFCSCRPMGRAIPGPAHFGVRS